LKELRGLKQLGAIRVADTKITEGGVEELKTFLPNLMVERD
jgi:hypothetical protein